MVGGRRQLFHGDFRSRSVEPFHPFVGIMAGEVGSIGVLFWTDFFFGFRGFDISRRVWKAMRYFDFCAFSFFLFAILKS